MTERRLPRPLAVAGNVLLWVTAVLGTISILLALATVVAGVQPLIFRSSSMSPAIDAGALALARTVDVGEVEVGDVVSVEDSQGVRVTHRVVSIDDAEGDAKSLQLQGDTNAQPDEEAYLVTEVDRVFFDVPYLGHVANWASSPWAMFLAGIVVALVIASLWMRPGARGGAAAGAAAVVAALGLATQSLASAPTTEAYFTDRSVFEAGTLQAHQLRIFEWGSPVCTDNADKSITLRTVIASKRYHQVWYAARSGAATPSTPFLTVTPPGEANTVVETKVTRGQLGIGASETGLFRLTGRSQLKGAATTPWQSASSRTADVSVTDDSTIRCGTVNTPPNIVFTSPTDGATFGSTGTADRDVAAICRNQPSPCGTATDPNGISRVQYRLQRANGLGTQCWTPGAFLVAPGFYLAGCSNWRDADVSAVAGDPSTSYWQIPVGGIAGPGTTFNQSGRYTLYLRAYDNSSEQMVSERVIQFTVG